MKVYHSIAELPPNIGRSVVTVGNFDGVHVGHRRIIDAVIGEARERSALAFALTFDPHPVRFLRPQHAPKMITPSAQRIEKLARTGLDAALILPFDSTLANLSAEEFAQQILHDRLHAISVHEGEQFRFGRAASGDLAVLTTLGERFGFRVHVHGAARVGNDVVSSSRVRELIANGQVSRARALLGEPFSLCSTPAVGRGYGSRYTVPTINMADYSELTPRPGVYIACLEVDGEPFHAVTNVGTRPTFGAGEQVIESHLLDFRPIALGPETPLRLTFLLRLRNEIRWPSADALRAQIAIDVQRSRRYFRLLNAVTAPGSTPASLRARPNELATKPS